MKLQPIVRNTTLALPVFSHTVQAGFPSPADDYIERRLDLSEHLVLHPSATYYVRAEGDSMLSLGIHSGDLLIVDRSVEALHGDVVIAALGGELTCKVLDLRGRRLLSGNDQFPPMPLGPDTDLVIEGVVTASVRYHRPLPGM